MHFATNTYLWFFDIFLTTAGIRDHICLKISKFFSNNMWTLFTEQTLCVTSGSLSFFDLSSRKLWFAGCAMLWSVHFSFFLCICVQRKSSQYLWFFASCSIWFSFFLPFAKLVNFLFFYNQPLQQAKTIPELIFAFWIKKDRELCSRFVLIFVKNISCVKSQW